MLHLIHKIETKILTDISQTTQQIQPPIQKRIYNLKRDSNVKDRTQIKYSHEHHCYMDKNNKKYIMEFDEEYQ